MPSPFPGMDPFLEAPGVWPDVHNRLATIISEMLNGRLPTHYFATMEMRAELGIVAEEPRDNGARARKRVVPDLVIMKHAPEGRAAESGVAVLDAPARTVSANIEFDDLPDEPVRDYFVEIRDARQGHKLVTLIEILSPANKRPGPDRELYVAKQAKVLETDVNLIEIDLLRGGQRLLACEHLEAGIAKVSPPPDYLVMVSRAARRWPPFMGYIAYPITLRDMLPCIEIPLRAGDPLVALDLQAAFDRVYDTGPYRRGAIDYDTEPEPPIADMDREWVIERLRAAFEAK